MGYNSDFLDKVIVLDIESTCWQPRNSQPKNEISEIIEIGLAIVNTKSLSIEDKESIIIKPVRSKISKFCTELTTLTQEQVDKGIFFEDACTLLQDKYSSKNFTWISWGAYDRKMFESQCRETCVEYPFGKNHINLKNIFAIMYGIEQELNVPKALDYLNLSFEGTLHRGIDDAHNIARIFIHSLKTFRKK